MTREELENEIKLVESKLDDVLAQKHVLYQQYVELVNKDLEECCEEGYDEVDHPGHYNGKYECIDVMIDCFGTEWVQIWSTLNAFKYLYRCRNKHQEPITDIRKAQWFMDKVVQLMTSDIEKEFK